MDAITLKNSILELAIQGKLVKQYENEETGSQLFERIVKERNIMNIKTLKEEDIPFEIPKTWKWVSLGDIIEVKGGKRIPAGRKLQDSNNGYPYIRVADMKNGTVLLENIKYIPIDIYDKIKNYKISKDDLYITVAGTIGTVGMVPDELDQANITENANKLVLYGVSKEYIYYTLSSSFIQNQIRNFTTKVGQPKLAIKRINTLLLPLPPLKEQERIVEKIEEISPKISEFNNLYKEVLGIENRFPNELRKSILQYATRGKVIKQSIGDLTGHDLYKDLTIKRDELIEKGIIKRQKNNGNIVSNYFPFDIPDTWKWVRLSDIAFLRMGKTPPRSENKYWSSDIPWISIADMKNNNFTSNTKEKISNLALETKFNNILSPKGTLIMSFKLTIGKVSILDIDAVHNEAIVSIFPFIDHENILRNYLFKTLPLLVNYANTKGAIKGKTLNSTSLNNLMIPLPSLEEQKMIVNEISTFEKFIDTLKNL